jgi:ABC-type transporter Mla subunit MlaD
MIALGLLLLAATGAFTGLLIADNLSGGPEYTVSVLGHDIVTMNVLAVFCSGLALALIFCLGLSAVASAGVHRRRQRTTTYTAQPGNPAH